MTKMQMLLMDIITADGAEWSDIVSALQGKNIKGWHKVRNELQELIKLGFVRRLNEHRSEIYVRT